MGERKHKAESGEKKDRVGQGNKASAQVAHPILQLQQLVGNKAVTNMLQKQAANGGRTGPSQSRNGEFDKLKVKNLTVDELAQVGALNTRSVAIVGGSLYVNGNIVKMGAQAPK